MFSLGACAAKANKQAARPLQPMHSFRHLWRTLGRECEMPESISRSIMGHTLGGGEHGAYGAAHSLKLRAEWIAKIQPLGQ